MDSTSGMRRSAPPRRFARSWRRPWGAAEEQELEFFDPFVPDVVTLKGSPYHPDVTDVPWEDLPTDVLIQEKQCWEMRKGASWHGYRQYRRRLRDGGPVQARARDAGLRSGDGKYLDWGIPASVLAVYLRERGIVPEKNDLNTILFLITPGIETSKAGALIAALGSIQASLRSATRRSLKRCPRLHANASPSL